MAEKTTINELWLMKIDWQMTTDAYIYTATIAGQQVRLRLNSFPDEPMCTVIWSDNNEQDLDDLSKQWTLPKERGK
jgi:hypothetical protein